MSRATFVQTKFLGGEWSQSAQGRIDSPDYRSALNVCKNAIPIENGAWQRRGGTQHCGTTRAARAAKLIGFDFRQRFPYQALLSDGILRFLSETNLVTTNDDATIASISAANPAVITTAAAHGWSTANQALIASNVTQLMNRQVAITVLSPTTFSIADAVTGVAINGGGLDAFSAGTVKRIAEIATPYAGENWRNVRSIQAETSAVLVNGLQAPYVLSVAQAPTDTSFAEFDLEAANFLDGPYLDPIPGSYITASAVSGFVTLTLSFQPYDSGRAYNLGDYVTLSGQAYKSRIPNNQNHAPNTSPAQWLPVNAGDPLNNGAGFISADIGRLVRLFSEPPLWDAGLTYSAGQVVAYTIGDATQYWLATGAIGLGVRPGTSVSWQVATGVTIARWTWGRILAVTATGITFPNSFIGDMTGGGGLASVFDGVPSKPFASSAGASASTATWPAWQTVTVYPIGSIVQFGVGVYQKVAFHPFDPLELIPPPGNLLWSLIGGVANLSLNDFVGGHMPAPTPIASATVTPTTDIGFTNSPQNAVTLNLRAKSTAPASPSDGTLLGSTGSIADTTSPVSIVSGDPTTPWNYVWIEVLASYVQPLPDDGSHVYTGKLGIAQVQLFTPNIANGSAISVQIVGDPLLYANACRTWRLGLFGGTNGYPTNGTYHEGRIWLSGVIGNRVDSSKSNVIRNGALVLNMAPTQPDGTVADDNAISAVFTGPDVNQVVWMEPDQQGIICGTQAGEWLISPAASGAMAPTNIAARRVTKVGCADVLPRRTDHTLVFAQKFLQKLQEYFADIVSGKFASPNLTKNSKHLTVPGLAEIAYQQELAPIVWSRLANGALIGHTYQRDSNTVAKGPDISAAHRHEHGGSRAIRSISVGASADGNLDSLFMITEDAAGGVFHVEAMTSLLSEGFNPFDCWFVDNGIVPSAVAVDPTVTADAPYGGLRLYGLWPHNGKTVAAWLYGLDCGSRGLDAQGNPQIIDFIVSNGSILVPFGDSVSQGCGDGLFTQALVTQFAGLSPLPMVVGFPFVSDGQIVRPALPTETGTRTGPGLGRFRRTDHIFAQLYGCVNGKISFGTDFNRLQPASLRESDDETALTVQQLYSGIYRHTPEAESDLDNMVCWRVARPHPAFVVAVGASLKAEDE